MLDLSELPDSALAGEVFAQQYPYVIYPETAVCWWFSLGLDGWSTAGGFVHLSAADIPVFVVQKR